MLALLVLLEQKARPPGNDVFPVLDEMMNQLLQPHRARLAVHQRDVDDANGDLAWGVLIKLIDDDIGIGVALQVHHDPALVFPAAVIVDVTDVLDEVLLHALRDGFDDRAANDPIGDLGNDNNLFAAFDFFSANLREGSAGRDPSYIHQ